MSDFKWHMMAEEMPEKGKKDYLVMGLKGGLYLAPRFEGYGERGDDVWFRDTRGNHHYPDKVLAWAEVPKLEDRNAQGSENAKLREQGARLFDKTLELGTENEKLRELVRKWYPHMLKRVGRDALEQWGQMEVVKELGIEVQG